MHIYIWDASLETGAVHEDGSAVVAAESLEAAIALLEPESSYYHFAEAARAKQPDRVLAATGLEAGVLLVYSGCDC